MDTEELLRILESPVPDEYVFKERSDLNIENVSTDFVLFLKTFHD
jgi:hypothetical protein